jgi:hypothetical protein
VTVFIINEGQQKPAASVEAPVRAYRHRDNAQAECDRLNAQGESRYRVAEVQVAEEEVESYDALRARVAAAKERARELTHEAFLAGCRALFEAHEGLESFSWEQYTPYYCDGEPCEFSVWYDCPVINGLPEDEVDDGTDYDAEHNAWALVREPYPEAKFQCAVKEFLQTFPDDDLMALFGDHASITVLRDGTIEVEDWTEHD